MVKTKVLKTAIIVALLLLTPGILIAGGTQEEDTGTGVDKVELVFWQEANEETSPTWQATVEEYMRLNPNVTIEYVPGGGGEDAMADYDVKLTLALTAGKGPDIFSYHDVAMYKYVLNNLIVPAPDYVADQFRKDALNEGVLEGGTFDGKIYGPIYQGDWQVLYYNKDMFTEAGLDPDKPPTNWEEYMEYGAKLAKTDANGNLIRAGISLRKTGHPQGIAAKWLTFFLSAGGQEFSDDYQTTLINSEAGIKALELYQDILYDSKIDSIDVVADWKGFAQKTVAMFNRGPWVPAALASNAPDMVPGVNYGAVIIPAGLRSSSIGSNYPLVVTKKCQAQEDAWEFISWFMEPDVYAKYNIDSGQFPMTKSVAEMEEFANDPIFSVFFSQPNVVPPPELINLYELESILGKYLEDAIYNNTPAKQALDAAAEEMNALL